MPAASCRVVVPHTEERKQTRQKETSSTEPSAEKERLPTGPPRPTLPSNVSSSLPSNQPPPIDPSKSLTMPPRKVSSVTKFSVEENAILQIQGLARQSQELAHAAQNDALLAVQKATYAMQKADEARRVATLALVFAAVVVVVLAGVVWGGLGKA
ncbi:unnamed protein product [Zymoseptoria tritici ST99CH_1A5]|uniref:Uncharacterized protein n=1 Tax=Zymoseptoria tritici ST99CH_1A5 TaxID=1276529 RepID=A0A1Y6M0Q1_ZYMTR|nr:unnamed protein product [Zymoseptoria tritici ST99CH_3D1]SMY30224.1 unnamed protein product [Zymoseptoria tritici ST99CH_1A5]